MDFLGVADFVEAERAAELAEHQGKDLFLVAEPAGFDAASFGKRLHHARRNELDNLGQGGQTPPYRFGCCVFSHGARIVRRDRPHSDLFCPPVILPRSQRLTGFLWDGSGFWNFSTQWK